MYTAELIFLCAVGYVQALSYASVSDQMSIMPYSNNPRQSECIANAMALENSTTINMGYTSMCHTYCDLIKDSKIEKDGAPIVNMIPPERRAAIIACDAIYKNMTARPCSRAHHLKMCFDNTDRTEKFALSQACLTQQKKVVPQSTYGPSKRTFVYLDCYNRCIAIKKGQFNEKNEIVGSRFVDAVPKGVVDVEEVAKECNAMYATEPDVCQQFTLRKKCFNEKTVGVLTKYIHVLTNYMALI